MNAAIYVGSAGPDATRNVSGLAASKTIAITVLAASGWYMWTAVALSGWHIAIAVTGSAVLVGLAICVAVCGSVVEVVALTAVGVFAAGSVTTLTVPRPVSHSGGANCGVGDGPC